MAAIAFIEPLGRKPRVTLWRCVVGKAVYRIGTRSAWNAASLTRVAVRPAFATTFAAKLIATVGTVLMAACIGLWRIGSAFTRLTGIAIAAFACALCAPATLAAPAAFRAFRALYTVCTVCTVTTFAALSVARGAVLSWFPLFP